MDASFFNPFEDLIFDENFCFLSGKLTDETITVYPEWLMNHFKFGEERIELMDKSKSYRYMDLKMPCSPEVKTAFDQLDEKIKEAYQNGYEGMVSLDEELIFQWVGRMVYGMIYHEMLYERKRLSRMRKEFDISPFLKERFSRFHLMLQSLTAPVSFSGRKPWSLVIFPLKYSADIFSYRDDSVNLLFSMGVNGFGLIMCLQDNGVIAEKESELLEKIKGFVLHPVQFEELYARFHYSDYVLQYKPEYKITESEDGIFIESLPIEPKENRPLFGFWDENIYAQLLANYWQVYGIETDDILQFQKPMLSYLENPYTKEFIDPESIELPY